MQAAWRRSLINLANAAALGEESAWENFLNGIAKRFHVSSAALITPEPDAQQRVLARAIGSCVESAPVFLDRWVGKDVWAISSEERGRFIVAGDCGVGEEIVEDSRLKRSAYFNEFCVPFEISHILALKITDRSDPIAPVTHLSLMSTKPIDPVRASDLKSLWQPLQRAVHAFWLLDRHRNLGSASERSLDAMPAPTWIVGADAKVIFANQAARAIGDQTLTTASGGRLTAVGDLRVADLLKLSPASVRAPIIVGRGPDVQRATLHVVAIDERCSFALAWPEGRYLLMVEGITEAELDKAWLMRIALRFGLSDRESAVLGVIAKGGTTNDVCTALGVSEATVRTHLSTLFQKTGCKRQAELVRLALRGSHRQS